MQIHWRFAKNALANLGRGGAAAFVALALPPVLVRHMPPASYAVWVLVLQTATYISFLDLGLQTAIGRYVAYANEKKDTRQRDEIFSTAFAALCCAALIALLCAAAAVLAVPVLFPSISSSMIPQMRLALLIVSFSMALQLPASAWNGVFIGMQRYEIPAMTIGGARLLSFLGVIVVVLTDGSLVLMASVLALANLLSYLAQYLAFRRLAPEVHFRPAMVSRSTAKDLAGYCFGLTVMSLSMLLVSGFDLILVGHFQFAAVTPYSVAANMIALITGLILAVVNVLMPHAATLHASQKAAEIGRLVVSATRVCVLLLVITGVPILIYAGPIMHLWIGQRYVATGAPLLAILVIANMIRLIGAPYSTILVAAGQQSIITISPIAEGILNFSVSAILGFFMGGIGVALGTLFGAFIGVGTHLVYSMTRTRSVINFSRRDFLFSGVVIPLLSVLPLLAIAAASMYGIFVHYAFTVAAFVLSATGGLLLVFWSHKKGDNSPFRAHLAGFDGRPS